MTDGLKDLNFYAANPDQLPTDPEQLEALMAQLEGGEATTESTEQSEQSATDGAASAAGEGGTEDQGEAKQQGDDQEQEAPIASKDGKHTIPYNVLATEREKRRAAEQAMRELQDRLAAAEAGKPGKDAGQLAQGETTDEELEQMASDFPAVKKLLEHTRRIEAQLSAVAKRVEQDDAQRQQQEMAAVRAAVDANPVLLHWEGSDPDRWQAAIEADQRLQASPAHQGLSLDERLAKAVEIVNAFYGDDPTAPSREKPQPAARTAALAAPKVVGKPRTLSDIPGGAVPSTDPLEEFASISAAELGAKMANMNPDQISALLEKLG